MNQSENENVSRASGNEKILKNNSEKTNFTKITNQGLKIIKGTVKVTVKIISYCKIPVFFGIFFTDLTYLKIEISKRIVGGGLVRRAAYVGLHCLTLVNCIRNSSKTENGFLKNSSYTPSLITVPFRGLHAINTKKASRKALHLAAEAAGIGLESGKGRLESPMEPEPQTINEVEFQGEKLNSNSKSPSSKKRNLADFEKALNKDREKEIRRLFMLDETGRVFYDSLTPRLKERFNALDVRGMQAMYTGLTEKLMAAQDLLTRRIISNSNNKKNEILETQFLSEEEQQIISEKAEIFYQPVDPDSQPLNTINSDQESLFDSVE